MNSLLAINNRTSFDNVSDDQLHMIVYVVACWENRVLIRRVLGVPTLISGCIVDGGKGRADDVCAAAQRWLREKGGLVAPEDAKFDIVYTKHPPHTPWVIHTVRVVISDRALPIRVMYDNIGWMAKDELLGLAQGMHPEQQYGLVVALR